MTGGATPAFSVHLKACQSVCWHLSPVLASQDMPVCLPTVSPCLPELVCPSVYLLACISWCLSVFWDLSSPTSLAKKLTPALPRAPSPRAGGGPGLRLAAPPPPGFPLTPYLCSPLSLRCWPRTHPAQRWLWWRGTEARSAVALHAVQAGEGHGLSGRSDPLCSACPRYLVPGLRKTQEPSGVHPQ